MVGDRPLGVPAEIVLAAGARPQETLSGLLVTVARTAQDLGFFDTLLDGLALPMKVYRYTPRDKVAAVVASILAGCRHTSEVQTKLVPDTVAAGLFGLPRFPDQATLNHFLGAFGPAQVAHLAAAHERLLVRHSRAGDRALWVALPDGRRVLPVDLDQTYLVTRSPKAEGATKGYFGRKRGQRGYKKSVAFLGGGVKEVLYQRLEAGNTHPQVAVPAVLGTLGTVRQAHGIAPDALLVRGDSQYGTVGVVRQVQAAGHHYLLKGYTPRTAQALAAALPTGTAWQERGTDSYGSRVFVAEGGVHELRGADEPPDAAPVRTRIVLLKRVGERTRKKPGRGAPGPLTQTVVHYEHYLTDLPATALAAGEVVDWYDARETEESYFRAEQDAFGAHYLRTKRRDGQAAFLWLLASTVNLLRWTQQTTLAGTPLEQAGLTKLVTQALRLPATIVQTGRTWSVLLPETVRLVRHLVLAWLQRVAQLPLPLPEFGYSP